jgi:hypothetical protein
VQLISRSSYGISSVETAAQPKYGIQEAVVQRKFQYLLDAFLPYLRDRLSRSFIKQTLEDTLDLDSDMIGLLVEKLLTSPAEPESTTARFAVEDLLDLRHLGLTGQYTTRQGESCFVSDDFGREDHLLPSLETEQPIETATWSGYLTVPETGDYRLYVHTPGEAKLWLGDAPDAIIQPGTSSNNERVALKAGQLYPLHLKITGWPETATTLPRLAWSSPQRPKESIPSHHLYPSTVISKVRVTLARLHKAAIVVNGFDLSTREVEYLAHHAWPKTEANPAVPKTPAPSYQYLGLNLQTCP